MKKHLNVHKRKFKDMDMKKLELKKPEEGPAAKKAEVDGHGDDDDDDSGGGGDEAVHVEAPPTDDDQEDSFFGPAPHLGAADVDGGLGSASDVEESLIRRGTGLTRSCPIQTAQWWWH
jgi:hypothetical protein